MAIRSAWDYQLETSYDRLRMEEHFMDWANQPDVYKRYAEIEGIGLPSGFQWPEASLSKVILRDPSTGSPEPLTKDKIAKFLLLSYTHTARLPVQGGYFYYRSAPSAGALYPCEMYVALDGIGDPEDGIHHYAVQNHSLISLRKGNPVPAIKGLVQGLDDAHFQAFVFITAIFYRSSWKYRKRAYRYHLLDTGHLLENVTSALKLLDIPHRIWFDFDDAGVNDLLCLDERREACLAVLGIECGAEDREDIVPLEEGADGLRSAAGKISEKQTNYEEILDIHGASSVVIKKDGPKAVRTPEAGPDARSPESSPEVMGFVDTVFRRRSRRNFLEQTVSREILDYFLRLILHQGFDPHEIERFESALSVGLVIENVQGLDPGIYTLNASDASLNPVFQGRYAARMARVCLDQNWLADAAVHFCFIGDFHAMETVWGPRGYRYAMIAAGRLAERIYLGATTLGFGCCGIGAFYDKEAAELLNLKEHSRMLYLIAAGPMKRTG